MRLMFVHWVVEDRGSPQDIYNYAPVARALGHEVALYGPPNSSRAFNDSLGMRLADKHSYEARLQELIRIVEG
jgi:hypothetical protein